MKRWIQCTCFIMSLLVFMGCEKKVLPREEKSDIETKIESVKETVLESETVETEDNIQKISVNNTKETLKKPTAAATQKEPVLTGDPVEYCGSYDGFFGIWVFASKDFESAYEVACEVQENGFWGGVYVTTDWSNLNKEKWYVVTAGTYSSREDAQYYLSDVQKYYKDAYVKFSGYRQGDSDYEPEYEGNQGAYYNAPFYGIWVSASKDYDALVREADELARRGYYSNLFVTTDWSNLNKEKWYVLSAGIYATREDAEAMLWSVQKDYPDAYVKYSGDWIGTYGDVSYDGGYCESPQNPGFYGIWFFASKDDGEAWDAAVECCQNGFEGQMYVTTDWSNLNNEKWYVVTAGAYVSREDAEAMLPYVQYIYPDAYIKYTGEWQG